jgi:glycosyltransferase involved in cell wall biosynthesis
MDALLLPDGVGSSHSIVLDAMAAGMSVLAAPDELVEVLIDGRTSRLVPSATKADWERAIRETVLNQERWSLLGASSRDWVRTNRTVSAHIAAVIETYSQAQRLHELDRTARKAVA